MVPRSPLYEQARGHRPARLNRIEESLIAARFRAREPSMMALGIAQDDAEAGFSVPVWHALVTLGAGRVVGAGD